MRGSLTAEFAELGELNFALYELLVFRREIILPFAGFAGQFK